MSVRPEADAVIAFLNSLVAIDRDFVTALIDYRPPCNEAMANHPSVQVGGDNGEYHAGALGLLNGFLGTIDSGPKTGWGPITALYTDAKIAAFQRTEQIADRNAAVSIGYHPMAMSPIERAARELCEADGHDPDGASCGDPDWMFYQHKVRIVIEAIRDPGDAASAAGDRWSDRASLVWQDMIAEILK